MQNNNNINKILLGIKLGSGREFWNPLVVNHRTCEFPGMADSIEEVLEERREERARAERARERLREERLIRAAVEPVVKSMSSEDRVAIARLFNKNKGMLRQPRDSIGDSSTLARLESEGPRGYL